VSILLSLGLRDVLNEDGHPVGFLLHLLVFRGADSDAQVQVGLAVLIGHHSLVGYHTPALAVSLNATFVKVGNLLLRRVFLVVVLLLAHYTDSLGEFILACVPTAHGRLFSLRSLFALAHTVHLSSTCMALRKFRCVLGVCFLPPAGTLNFIKALSDSALALLASGMKAHCLHLALATLCRSTRLGCQMLVREGNTSQCCNCKAFH